MTKGVKKGLAVLGGLLLLVILAIILIPVFFKDKIKEAVVATANKQLNAKLEIGDFGLSLIKNFPNATLSLEKTLVIGSGEFSNDTLLNAGSANITVDIYSLFGDNYKVSKINLEEATINAKVAENGKANWDIVKTDSLATEPTAEESSAFKLDLNDISLSGCNVIYDDQVSKMRLMLNNLNGNISGDFSASETTLKTSLEIEGITFEMEGIKYLSKIKGLANAKLNANFDSMKFNFIESEVQLNELKASIDGSFAFVGEEGMDFDLKLKAPQTQFKDILSLMPAMYTEDFKNIKTSGTATLDAYVQGLMEGETYPAFDVKILISDAMFQYPSLPKSVNNINVDVKVNSKGGSLDNTQVNISKFSFTLGGNPFSGNLNITTPMSDPNLKLHAKGAIDLGMVKEVYPFEKGTQLNGKLNADINLATRMSAIEKEQYEQVSATGFLKINDMNYKAENMPEVLIKDVSLDFTPRYVNLTSLNVKINKNDISATGRLENFIPYAMKDQTLKGQLNIQSNYFNVNDFISEETSGTEAEGSATSEDIIIPKNVDFTLNANLKQVLYGKINITNMNGGMGVKDGILSLNNVSANALNGSCKINGTYNTSDPKNPKVNFAINLTKVSFAETFKQVEAIKKLAPIFENLHGTYSMNLNFNTSLGSTMMQTLGALTASGSLQTNDIKVENVAALNALSSALNTDALKTISPKDINLPFSVDNGRVKTKPFSVNLGNGGAMKLEGSTGLDETIDYKGNVTLPQNLTNKYVNNVPITIGGTFKSPKVNVDFKSVAEEAVKEVITNVIGDKLGGKDIQTAISDEKIKQAQKIRDEAQKASDKLVEEAQKQADELTSKVKNPLEKMAAQAVGKKLVEEAKKQGQNIINKADEKVKELESK